MDLLPLLLASLASAGVAQELVTPGDGRIALAPGRVATLLDAIPPGTVPRASTPPWPAWTDRSASGWGGEAAWRRWVELARAEAAASRAAQPGAPERRAQLCVLARLQGRDGDAWQHLLACARDPGLVAGLVPLLSPGVPPELAAEIGALPDGVVLSPALPPGDDPRATLRVLAGTRIERHELAIGAARCTLSLSVDRDGLELGLRHVGGGAARVRLVPPLPRGVDPGELIADWEKLPGHVGPVEFALDSESNEHTLWLSFRPPRESWPSPPLERIAAWLPGREIVLESTRGDEPHLRRFAEALGELLEAPARLRAEGAPPGFVLEPLVLRFGAGSAAERKLVELVGLAEAFVLYAQDR